jgi:ATP-dependent RNA helicase HelY
VVEALNREGLLPAIFFVFSRAGCEAAADQCRQAGLALTTPAQSARIDAVLERRALALPTGDLGVVGYHEFADQARAGFAPHHAGMLPLFKEAVEELFQEGLLKVVFATETLSLGINMPARTVVMDRLDKWDGTAHTDLTPGEYTQLTGRAGRRGIDVEGHAVVVAGPRVNAAQVAPLASKRTYPLRSAFHATYNMAVNLTARLGPDPARQTLGLSFAQFQADRSVAGLAGQIRQLDQAIDGYEQAMSCDQGDFREFQQLRDRLSKLEKQAAQSKIQARRAQTRAVLSQLKRGDVLRASSGRGGGLMLVIHPGKTGQGRPLVLTEQGKVRRVVLSETGTGLNLVGHIKLAGQDTAKTTQQRDGLVHRMLAVANEAPPSDGAATVVSSPTEPTGPQLQDQIKDLRAELRSHPVASCPDREAHARWSRRWTKTITQRERLVRSMENRTGSLVRQFDRISAVLGELGYLDGGEVTSAGRILARIYAERDLTIAECVRQGIWESLAAPDLAAALTALVYEPRTEVPPVPEPLNGVVRQTIAKQQRIWEQIRSLELHHGVPASPGVAPAASALVGRWAAGQGLADTLRGGLLSPGDFVRLVSRVVDVLDHIRSVAPTEGLYRAAESAIRQLRRGVVVFEQA